MAINYKLGNLDVNDTSPEVLAKLFGRKLGMPNQSVAAPTSMQEILGLPGKVADWDGQSNTDMTGTDAGFYTGKLPSLNSGGATGSWDSVQPEQQAKQTAQKQQAKQTAQIAQVKAQSSLGKTPEEGKNTLQKLGMLFRGLGATTAAFDEGMRSKFIADKPGIELANELQKDQELSAARQKAAYDMLKEQQKFDETSRHNRAFEAYYGKPGNAKVKDQEIMSQAIMVAKQEDIPLDDALVKVKAYYGNTAQPSQTTQAVTKRSPVDGKLYRQVGADQWELAE